MKTLNENSINNEALAWAAGFLDGEGHFGFQTSKSKNCDRGSLVIEARQVRREPLDKLSEIFGGNITGPYSNKGQGYYSWHTTAAEKVKFIIDSIWPWLTEPKREQAGEALKAFDNRRPSKIPIVSQELLKERRRGKPVSEACPHGHERNPETIYVNPSGSIGCKTCRRLSRQKWAQRKKEL